MVRIKSQYANLLRETARLHRGRKKTDGPQVESQFVRFEYEKDGHLILRSTDSRLSFKTRVPCDGGTEPWSVRIKCANLRDPFRFLDGAGWRVSLQEGWLVFQQDRMVCSFRNIENETPFVEPDAPEPGRSVIVNAQELLRVLSFVTQGAEPSDTKKRQDDKRRGVCTLFADGVAMGATSNVNWKTLSLSLPFGMSLSKGDAKRLVKWLRAIAPANPNSANDGVSTAQASGENQPEGIEIAETISDRQCFYRFRTTCGSCTAWVIKYPTDFLRLGIERPLEHPCSLELRLRRTEFLTAVKLLGGMNRKLVCRFPGPDDSLSTLRIETDDENEAIRSHSEVPIESVKVFDEDSGPVEFRVAARLLELATSHVESESVVLSYRPRAGKASVSSYGDADADVSRSLALLPASDVQKDATTKKASLTEA